MDGGEEERDEVGSGAGVRGCWGAAENEKVNIYKTLGCT